MPAHEAAPRPLQALGGELVKLPAFLRRDFLTAWSYRMSFLTDILSLGSQIILFYFLSLMIDPSALPTFGGTEVTYLEFAAVGVALGVFMQLGLDRVATAIRTEQLMGTLESLLMTPTTMVTVQLGSVAYDLVYIPLRTLLFLLAVGAAFGLHFELSGLGPALAVLVMFIPFVWGLGVMGAAAILTYKRGAGLVGIGALGLAVVSGVYFPLELLPSWIPEAVELNPVAVAITGMRETLLGGASFSTIAPDLGYLAVASAVSLGIGALAFRIALARERRRGTLALY